jgi:hypothetical protein
VGYAQITIPSNGFVMVSHGFKTDSGVTYFEDVFSTNQLASDSRMNRCEIVYLWNVVQQKYEQYAQYNGQTFSALDWKVTPTNPVVSGGFFVQAKSGNPDHTIYLSGNVPTTNVIDVGIAGGKAFNMISYPFSSDIAISNLNIQGAVSNSRANRADHIYKWVVDRYEQYALYTDGKWYNVNEWTTTPTTDTVNLCEGFWYEANSNITWSASNIYYNAVN